MRKKKKNLGKRVTVLLIAIVLLAVFCYFENNSIVITNIKYTNKKIPNSFNGYKVLQVSDLHNKEFGENQWKLIKLTKEIVPDIIVITGDLIDSRKTDIATAMEYVSEAVKIAPVYFVSGNHEKWSSKYTELSKELAEAGVKIIDNEGTIIEKDGEKISLLGLQDIDFIPYDYVEDSTDYKFQEKLSELSMNVSNEFCILLSHRPEKIDLYADKNIDLVFSGHAHGGQFRIPFVGGLVAPNQGFFPKYTRGLYVKGDTSMVVSRGLGNSIIPLRIFNRPELVVVTLND